MPKKEKELVIARKEDGMYIVHYEGGGQVPKSLGGEFNKRKVAEDAIENYLTAEKRSVSKTTKPRGKKDGEDSSPEC